MNFNRDRQSVITSKTGMAFIVQKDWKELPAEKLSDLHGYQIIGTPVTNGSTYFMLRDMNIDSWMSKPESFRIVKISNNKSAGTIDYYFMDLNKDEAQNILDNPFSLWE